MDSDSDTSSRSSSMCEPNSILEDLVFYISADKNVWKSEKTCIKCYKKLGHGITHTKKHHCRFCYRAVCSECSPQKAYHRELNSQERVCEICLFTAYEKFYNELYSGEMEHLYLSKEELKGKIEEENQKKKRIVTECKVIEREIKEITRDYEEKKQSLTDGIQNLQMKKTESRNHVENLRENIDEEEITLKSMSEETHKLNDRISDSNKIIKQNKQVIHEKKDRLSELQDEHDKLIKALEKELGDQEIQEMKSKELMELEQNKNNTLEEIEMFKSQFFDLQNEVNAIDEKINKFNQETSQEMNREDSEKVTELKIQIQDQEFLLEKLRQKHSRKTKRDVEL